ncbi:MAG: tRNA uridine-5-carboxymethylaminomethyl(34) synthesis GTPase MnmE [Bacteroidales bacterium]|nr:tRNA uridine-5-carboxymethylaminomethyl(34) synthesis GTPase MnmE [Bacteroidales bacterium]
MQSNILNNDTICAIATPHGMGAIAVVRVSGSEAISVVSRLFKQNGKPFDCEKVISHKAYFGQIVVDGEMIDEVLVTFFKGPHSFTGEDSAEISVHGSTYIQQRLLEVLMAHGIRLAEAGEYTRRAFVNRKFDLAQAEAIADLISSESQSAHRLAISQLKGGFSKELQIMRSKLVEISALMELELDFSEEDVEFADRSQLKALLDETLSHVNRLTDSFRMGNAIKNGVPVAIVGATNAGKSTLLNALLGEERAIVSDIAGTTRDTIEETLNLDGTLFRFIDTAGLRETEEVIEKIGIERTMQKMKDATIVIGLLDINDPEINKTATLISSHVNPAEQQLILVVNKIDLGDNPSTSPYLAISAKTGQGLDELKSKLIQCCPRIGNETTMVTNLRHFEALKQAQSSLLEVKKGLEVGLPTDLITQDLRQALYYLGSITGEITTDEVLGTIFSRFCIGK